MIKNMKITITKNEKEFDCTAAWRIIGPVSYTHLDVYKRQVLEEVGSLAGVYPVVGQSGFHYHAGSADAVSYTHLIVRHGPSDVSGP